MGKKKTRSKYTSKGGVTSVTKSVRTAMKRARKEEDRGFTLIQKLNAWAKGKNTWFTIENPNKNETNKRFIRVKGSELLGDWRSNNKVILK